MESCKFILYDKNALFAGSCAPKLLGNSKGGGEANSNSGSQPNRLIFFYILITEMVCV